MFSNKKCNWCKKEIRNIHLTREEGQTLVKRFDGEFPDKYFEEIMEYLDMDPDHFHKLCDFESQKTKKKGLLLNVVQRLCDSKTKEKLLYLEKLIKRDMTTL